MSTLLVERRKRPPSVRRAGNRREIRCRGCGYGAVVVRAPARCPMCGGSSWCEAGRRRNEVMER